MWKYYELLTDLAPDEISSLKRRCDRGEVNPRDAKIDLAKLVISDFYARSDAQTAADNFISQFSEGNLPEEIDEASLPSGERKIADLLVEAGMVESKGEAKRLIKQGGVRLDGEKVEDAGVDVRLAPGTGILLQVGKRKFLNVRAE